MGLTYFKRYRMECDLATAFTDRAWTVSGYTLLPFESSLIQQHAMTKFESFCHELDSHVFPCLGRKDGCLRLMREIASRSCFAPESTWLCRYTDPATAQSIPVGTIQGLEIDGWGAIQNLGIIPEHRGKGLGSWLLHRAAEGFRQLGLSRMHLEVTTDNIDAIRLYERLGFRKAQVIYKAAEVLGAGVG
jgi:ribosomal protein S18 acetylase RimI-like enzyme